MDSDLSRYTYIVFSRPFLQTIGKEFGLSRVTSQPPGQTSPAPGPPLVDDEAGFLRNGSKPVMGVTVTVMESELR
jgi:hypothetical protein